MDATQRAQAAQAAVEEEKRLRAQQRADGIKYKKEETKRRAILREEREKDAQEKKNS